MPGAIPAPLRLGRMRLPLAAPVLAFALVAAGPSSARFSPAETDQLGPLTQSGRPAQGWSEPLHRPAWTGYPYRR